LWDSLAHIYLTTYETFRQDLPDSDCSWQDKIARKNFDVAVLDEIQKIKNPSAELTQSVRRIESERRWGLSGTPLENRTEELIAVFAFLKPKLLRYEDAIEPLVVKEKIRPYFLRRRKADVLTDLPEKNCDEVWLELSDAQKKAYERAQRDGIVDLNNRGDSVTVQHVLALITKLKQICNYDPATGESCKLEYLNDQLDAIADQGDKALIFSQYTDKTLIFLEPRLKQFNPHVYHGALSDSQRDKIIDEFQNRNDCKILLMSVKAGGLGLTLTRANFVFHFDLWWNPAVAAQAEDRAHRIGQKKTVYVTSLFTRNTIEEEIQRILKRKKALFAQIVDDLSDTNLSMTLSEDELFGLFGLQRPTRRYSGR
jgi:SNF2 family DNA or RNA helicase